MLKSSMNRLRSALRDRKLAGADAKDHLFHAPPFDQKMAAAAQLISTRLSIRPDEASRILWQSEANDAAMVEYTVLQPLLSRLPKPRKVLEIGPGFGRSLVVFSKLNVWADDAVIHLYDADGTATKYKQEHYARPPQWPDVSSFCGNLPLLREVLAYNQIKNYTLIDAAQVPLRELPGPYDLIFGFYSIGFHWSLEYYLDDINPLMHDRSVLICTLNKHFKPFPLLSSFSTRILQSQQVRKGTRPLSFMAISKSELPNVGKGLKEAYPD